MAQNGKGARGSGGGKSRNSGGSVKIVTKKDRETKAINDNILALRAALFKTDGKDKNVLEGIAAPFLCYGRNGIKASIEFRHKLSKDELDFTFNLTKNMMEEVYEESEYGWDDVDKKRELSENGARFLLVRESIEQDASSAAAGGGLNAKPPLGKLIGFIHFRFTVQGEVMDQMAGNTTLYVMDVQIIPECQRKGLGKHLITLMELISRRENMSSVSIPIQNAEHSAKTWVEKSLKGYNPDVSLTLYGFDSDEEGFEVYAKTFAPAAPKPMAVAAVSTTTTATATSAATVPSAKAPVAAVIPESVFTTLKAEIEREAQQSEENKLSDSFQENVGKDNEGDFEDVDGSDEEDGEEGEVDLAGVDVDQVVEQLSALFIKENGSTPTAEHIAQWRSAVSSASSS